MSYDPQYDEPPPRNEALSEQVKLPAIFLIIVAVLNILFGIYQLISAAIAAVRPAADMYDQMQKLFEQLGLHDALKGQTAEGLKTQAVATNTIVGVVALIAAIITLVGAIQMLRLRSHALAVTGAILAVIPCVSCSACCGLGEGIGIWALVVLFSEPVKAAFERAARGS